MDQLSKNVLLCHVKVKMALDTGGREQNVLIFHNGSSFNGDEKCRLVLVVKETIIGDSFANTERLDILLHVNVNDGTVIMVSFF